MRRILLNVNLCNLVCLKIHEYLKEKLNLDEVELEKLYLGIMIVVFNISELILVFIAAFFIGIIKEVLLFALIFTTVRVTAAGLHLKSNLGCLIITFVSYIGSAVISTKCPLNVYITGIISVVCILLLFKYAPADTENRPILDKEYRKKLKILTTIIASTLVFINLLLLNKVLFNLTMFALILETLSVLPYSYKLIKADYNNYKKYE